MTTTSQSYPLPDDEVHVWRVSLHACEDDNQECSIRSVLSSEEAARARSYRFSGDRDRFRKRRAAVRYILSSYVQSEARDLTFRFGNWGKPTIALPDSAPRLHFNLTHAGNRALVAVARTPLGIDIESRERLVSVPVAGEVFAPPELVAFAEVGERHALESFLKVWTSKEAYVKALGRGLSVPLSAIVVCVDPTKGPSLLRGLAQSHDGWFLRSVAEPGHVACLAIKTRARIKTFEFDF